MSKEEKYDFEIQAWLCHPPETLSRLKKFYKSIISIHLGGKGLQTLFSKYRNEDSSVNTRIYANYEINYPKNSNNEKLSESTVHKVIIQPDKNTIYYNNHYDENWNKLCPLCSGILITKDDLYKCHDCNELFREYLTKEKSKKE